MTGKISVFNIVKDNKIYYTGAILGSEPCPPDSVQGCLHAQVSLLEFSVLLPLSQGYRPGIDCRERGKVLGGGF